MLHQPNTHNPAQVRIEATPNPQALRFVVGKPLVEPGTMLEFSSPEQAEKASPLAAHVFNLPFVIGVFISNNFITVTKNDSIAWDLVQDDLKDYIQEFLLSNEGSASSAPITNGAESGAVVGHTRPNSPEEEQIIAVLDEYVTPAVAGDGGHIAFRSFQDGVLAVSLRGSCSGCPSSMITLKSGIENLMREMVPGVREVVAEEV
jgi:Fe-S cluster biogenesis protein NfuA